MKGSLKKILQAVISDFVATRDDATAKIEILLTQGYDENLAPRLVKEFSRLRDAENSIIVVQEYFEKKLIAEQLEQFGETIKKNEQQE